MNTGEIVDVHVTRSEVIDEAKEKKKRMDSKTPVTASSKRKVRPTQRLYVPPAQRNKQKSTNVKQEGAIESGVSSNLSAAELQRKSEETEVNFPSRNDIKRKCEEESDVTSQSQRENVDETTGDGVNVKCPDVQSIESTKNDDETLVIVFDNLKVNADKVDVDVEQEEMERAIVNINRKSRPLIKHVNIVNYIDDKSEELSDEDEFSVKKNRGSDDLEHVVELYDFPPTFRTQDLMQLYHDVNEESMYVKWCDETHALLVLSTPAQAKKALQIDHDIIKSRSMMQASLTAAQVASRCDLKPAMKRPRTNMQTARRLITSHLGTRSKISKEEQQRERDELRKAKELKRALRQSENDAWDGHPRPSTT